MTSSLTFHFAIGDRVIINDISPATGTVDGMGYFGDMSGIQYRVIYWSNGERKSEWMYPSEIREK